MNAYFFIYNKSKFTVVAVAFTLLLLGGERACGQTASATTTINIVLADVITIDSGSAAADGAVAFNYASAEDYNTLKTNTVPNSLIVTSTKNFDIKVKAEGASFTDGTNHIPVEVLSIRAVKGGDMGGTKNDVTLSLENQVLVRNAPLGSKLSLDLDYEIPALEASSNKILGKPAGSYTQKVTYTATAL
ncbi:MAG: peptidoglycan-binding protein LysM [Arenibacter latericius]|nr:peptidoglycan-binding protein LysM [Arenibacter latericius]